MSENLPGRPCREGVLGGENSTYKGIEVRAHSQGMGHVPQLPVAREP